MADPEIYAREPEVSTWQQHLGQSDRSSAYYYRKKEYYRQIIVIRGCSGQAGGFHVLTDDQLRQMKTEIDDREKQLRDEILRERHTAEELSRADNLRQAEGWRKKAWKSFKRKFDDLSSARRTLPKPFVKQTNRLREEKKKIGHMRRKWEREFHRANKFEREKREEDKKVKKLSDMVVRMRQMLVSLEDENAKLKNDLKDTREELKEQEADITYLDASIQDANERREKLEQELTRVLKDTADSDYKDLNEIHFALLRKTEPCIKINISQKYEPMLDEDGSVITLGDGAFGRVFAYRQKREHGKVVAMKVLHANADDYMVRRQEIMLEARLLRLFRGTGVFPHMHGVGSLGNDTAIAMEYLGDDTNFQVVTLNSWTRTTQVSVHHAKTVLSDILSAIHALHSMDILHNDIKGDNIIIKQSDHDLFSGYLVDLGNASTTFLSAVYDFGQAERDLYEEDPLLIHYAPELILENAFTTTATDLYQVGQLIYLMGEDVGSAQLLDIGKRCVREQPLERASLLEIIELVAQL